MMQNGLFVNIGSKLQLRKKLVERKWSRWTRESLLRLLLPLVRRALESDVGIANISVFTIVETS